MTTTTDNPLYALIDRVIESEKAELRHLQQRQSVNRKIVRNFITQGQESINNLEQLRKIINTNRP